MSRFLSLDKKAPQGAFGEVVTGELTPQVQLQFGTYLPPQLTQVYTIGSGASVAIDTTDKVLKLQTSAATNRKGIFESIQPATYHPGQGAIIRFTAVFTTGVAGANKFVGVGRCGEGYFIGFQGVDFGVLRRVGGVDEIQTLTITSGDDGTSGTFQIRLGDDGLSSVIDPDNNATVSEVARTIVETDFSDLGWVVSHSDIDKATPQTTATVYFKALNAEVKSGTFEIVDSSSGVVGTFSQDIAGVASTETFTASTDFNTDKLDGTGEVLQTIDFTKGNVYQIRYQWLGFGKIDFFIENPDTGEFTLIHEIKYANTETAPSIFRPTLPVRAEVENTTNNSNMTICMASAAAFTEGSKKTPARTFLGASNARSGLDAADGEVPLIALKNDLVFQGVENRHRLSINSAAVSVANAAAANKTPTVVFRARSGNFLTSNHGDVATVTNFVSFDVSKGWNFQTSSGRIDTTTDGVTVDLSATPALLARAGIEQFAITLSGDEHEVFDLGENFNDALLRPGDYFVITAEVIDGAASNAADVDVAVNWSDIFA
jgi:hypothetical protein